jgi:predicted dehydrogenase
MSAGTDGLRWAILGAGGIARSFTRDLQQAGLIVAAVGSRVQERADAFAAEFGLTTAHGSYEDLVADDGVDVVYVATPHPEHRANALLALDAGKHVLIEKPITLNAPEAQDVADRAGAQGLVAMEAMWTRFLPHMVRLREVLAEGAIGDVRALVADHTQRLPDDPTHRLNALELGGGALLDLGVYPISFASSLFGAPTDISATATFKETGADAQVATGFRYAGGQVASTLSSSVAQGPNVASVIGSEGRIEIDSVWYTATGFRYAGGQVASTLSSSVAQGPNVASVIGSEGRIEIDSVWYTATGFRRYDRAGDLVETCAPSVEGRGMQFQAFEIERLVREGRAQSDVMPLTESIEIMATMDEVRRQIGLRYPSE